MNSSRLSSGLFPTRNKAPEPSAALLALQDEGLELPNSRDTPISVSPQSNPAYDPNLRVSPLSIISTPSNFRPSPLPPPDSRSSQHVWRRRASSVDSVETTVSGIINLYTNLSKHSFRSEYEVVSLDTNSDAGSIEDSPPMPMVHQPKAQAYRDTIAPLLEHQFSSLHLDVPGSRSHFQSPKSLASIPLLLHADANPSVLSLRLTPDESRSSTRAGPSPSDRSIQITPEMPPLPPPSTMNKASIETSDGTTSYVREQKVNLEVADVRDAESWYDEPLSPISPEDLDYRNTMRESQQSAVSPQSPNTQRNHCRALALESLSPPTMSTKISPGLRSVHVIDMESGMVPPPLDLSRNRSPRSGKYAPVRQDPASKEKEGDLGSQYHGERSDLDLKAMKDSLSLSYERTSVQSSRDRLSGQPNPKDIERPRSAFSDSSDSFIIYDTFSGQVKALFRDKFGRKQEKKSNTRKSASKNKEGKKKSGGPIVTKNVSTAFTDDVESYKYPYALDRNTDTSTLSKDEIQPAYRMRTPDSTGILNSEQQYQIRSPTVPGETRRSSDFFSQLPRFADDCNKSSAHLHFCSERAEPMERTSTDRKNLAQPAIPLTGYQKYGVEVWYESSKKKRRAEREKLRKEAEKLETTKQKAAAATANLQTQDQSRLPRVYADEKGGTAYSLRLSGPGPNNSQPEFYRQAQAQAQSQAQAQAGHAHQTSSDSTIGTVTSATDSNAGTDSMRWRTSHKQGRKSGVSSMGGAQTFLSGYYYNNDLFEASGGKKKSGLASRLLMSSEEKRKKKVKESITIVGGGRMAGDGGASEERELVTI